LTVVNAAVRTLCISSFTDECFVGGSVLNE